jgi:transcriptional regulator
MARFSGCPKVIEETDRIDRLMYRIAHRYEGDHGWQPDQTDPGFMAGMRKGIVAFEMKIETWDGKAKLSQNKPAESITRIIRHLEDHDDHDLANEMRQILIKSQ